MFNISHQTGVKRSILQFRRQEGFTLLELIVAIQLSLFVISLAYIGYLLASKLFDKWQDKMIAENNLSLISTTLSKSLDKIHEIRLASDKELLAAKENSDSLHLYFDNHIWLNGEMVGDSSMSVQSARIVYWLYPTNKNSSSLQLPRVGGSRVDRIHGIQLELRLQKNSKSYSLEVFHRRIRYPGIHISAIQ